MINNFIEHVIIPLKDQELTVSKILANPILRNLDYYLTEGWINFIILDERIQISISTSGIINVSVITPPNQTEKAIIFLNKLTNLILVQLKLSKEFFSETRIIERRPISIGHMIQEKDKLRNFKALYLKIDTKIQVMVSKENEGYFIKIGGTENIEKILKIYSHLLGKERLDAVISEIEVMTKEILI